MDSKETNAVLTPEMERAAFSTVAAQPPHIIPSTEKLFDSIFDMLLLILFLKWHTESSALCTIIFKRNSSQVAKVRQLWSYKHSIKMLQENDKCFVSADTEKKYGRYST